jgi:hypothetical protein
MVDNPRQIPQHNAEQRELVARAQRRRQDFVRVDGMTSITDRIPTINSLITNPEALLERIPGNNAYFGNCDYSVSITQLVGAILSK